MPNTLLTPQAFSRDLRCALHEAMIIAGIQEWQHEELLALAADQAEKVGAVLLLFDEKDPRARLTP